MSENTSRNCEEEAGEPGGQVSRDSAQKRAVNDSCESKNGMLELQRKKGWHHSSKEGSAGAGMAGRMLANE